MSPCSLFLEARRSLVWMQNLGMKEDEIIENKMVSQSISNTQKKIEERMIVKQSVRSQAEWIERNFELPGQ
ncbi:MAG TPA: hypothetical protein VGQ04_03165 [Chitinophagaceae bacterium]|nr:hypothetical protein [Chitinophagaceae bacterium]